MGVKIGEFSSGYGGGFGVGVVEDDFDVYLVDLGGEFFGGWVGVGGGEDVVGGDGGIE